MKGKNHFTANRIRAIEERIRKHLQQDRPYEATPETIYLDSSDLLQLFMITSPTLRYWKEQGLLEHIRVKGKYFYKLSEVLKMIRQHRLPGTFEKQQRNKGDPESNYEL